MAKISMLLQGPLLRIAFSKEEARKLDVEQLLVQLRQFQHRARSGIQFLDNPSRDGDYLQIEVAPSAHELLSSPPKTLPQNLVLSLGRSRFESEIPDDFIPDLSIPSPSIRSAASSESDSSHARQSFRSIHHYLNTHFQLNREDCLAQLRRGIAAFREQLMANMHSEKTPSKKIGSNQKAALEGFIRDLILYLFYFQTFLIVFQT